MIAYKTSKDYKRLKELLDSGQVIITMSPGRYKLPSIGFSIRYQEGNNYYYALCGFLWCEKFPETFEVYCRDYEIEFIEPTEVI